MREPIMEIDDELDAANEEQESLSGFHYKNGFTLSCTDLGNAGIKIELIHSGRESNAIILPPGKTEEYGKWLLNTIGQRNLDLPTELPKILEKFVKVKKLSRMLDRDDKKQIKDASVF